MDFAPDASSHHDGADRTAVAPLGSPVRKLPDSYTELDLDDITGLRWDEPAKGPHKPPLPRLDDLEVLAALYELRFLLASQIGRRFIPDRALRSVQHRLNQMYRVGWLRRCEITTRGRGHNQRAFSLGRAGFELLRENIGRTRLARGLDPATTWRDHEVSDPRVVLHDLHANGWLFALEKLLRPEVVRSWRGPRAAIIDPPREKIRNQWVTLAPDRVPLGTGQHLSDLQLDEFKQIRPDLAVELDLSLPDAPRRVELLLELDRTNRSSANVEKFKRYDALLTAWALCLPRYKTLGEPPIAVFVVEDEEKALQFLKAADPVVTGRIGKWGVPESKWSHHGRRRMFWLAERDVHAGTLRAWRLPEHPPEMRRALHSRRETKLTPEQVPSLVPTPFLR